MRRVSFILPAHNEERLLPATLAALFAAIREIGDAIEPEVIVVSDASTDRTAEIARAAGARVESVELRQISRVRNAGAAVSSGGVLIFIDADTLVNAATIRAALAAIEAGAVGGGAIVRMDGKMGIWSRSFLWFWNTLARVRGIAAGCFVYVRREDFEAVGGFSTELFASEEVELSAALRKRGRFVVLREPVLTSGRKLRTYSRAEILGPLLKFMFKGRNALTKREGLELWYERRDEAPSGSPPRGRG
jgi:glycosyltransferase involved in cell wall biosynthesis